MSGIPLPGAVVPLMIFGNFSGLDNWESLCRKSADYCKKFVKDATSCEKTNAKGYYFFIEKEECGTIVDDDQSAAVGALMAARSVAQSTNDAVAPDLELPQL